MLHVDWSGMRCLLGADWFSKEFLEVIVKLAPHQHVRKPMRIFAFQKSILNLVLSPRSSDVEFKRSLRPNYPLAPGCPASSAVSPDTQHPKSRLRGHVLWSNVSTMGDATFGRCGVGLARNSLISLVSAIAGTMHWALLGPTGNCAL